jgi:hypothetical protein
MIEMRYTSPACEDVQPYEIDATIRISDEATATEMVETFVKVMEIATMSNYNIARALKEAYHNFIYEKELEDEEISIED